MRIALNGATTMRAVLETDFAAAKAAGFDYVEIWAAKLRKFVQHQTADDLTHLITKTGVPPLSINSIEHVTFRDAPAYESIKAECEELSRIAATSCPIPARWPSVMVPLAAWVASSFTRVT